MSKAFHKFSWKCKHKTYDAKKSLQGNKGYYICGHTVVVRRCMRRLCPLWKRELRQLAQKYEL